MSKSRVNYVIPFRGRFFLIERCIQSLMSQKNGDWLAHIVEDASEWDDTDRKRLHVLVDNEPRITLLENSERQGPLHNVYNVIVNHLKGDDTIIAQLDGDDWLLPNATDVILGMHKQSTITYGQFLRYAPWTPWHMKYGHCREYPPQVILANSYEDYPWVASHLKTFKRKCFTAIPYEMMIDPRNGNFWNSSYDMAYMLPMLKMIEDKNEIYFNSLPICMYNMENWDSEHVKEKIQVETAKFIAEAVKLYIDQGKRFDNEDSNAGSEPRD